MRKTLTAAVIAAMALAPAGAALAQDAEDPVPTETTTEESSVLERWLDAIARLVGEATAEDPAPEEGTDPDAGDGEGGEPSDEGDSALDVLLDELLRGIEIQLMIDQAMAEVEETEEGGETDEGGETAEGGEAEEADGGDADEANHGALVSTVAQCAPRGKEAKGFLEGAKNHGAYVSAVARGATITLDVPNVVEADNELGLAIDGSESVELTVETLADAEALCAALATIAEARALEAELAALEGEDEKALRKAERDEAKQQRAADRDAAKAARDEAKAQRDADRAAAKAQRDADRAAAKSTRGGSGKGRTGRDG